MPKFAGLIACERVIVEEGTRVVSAIGMFSKLTVPIPHNETPPENAVVPKEWSIIAAWDPIDGEEGREFTLCVELFFPDGKPFVETTRSKFKIERDLRSHNSIKLLGFPVGQQGRVETKAWLESDGRLIGEKFSLYLFVEHKVAEAPPLPSS